uniref:hAT-like transposase RNase-H fold domain-containing protein n=1 Tax=Lactuca sativa TaxID=4236 RepID=A0A9R1VPJ9_LACSA|nr:hypothetical protein LSAT_V11C500250110 [Lactuca sativa]
MLFLIFLISCRILCLCSEFRLLDNASSNDGAIRYLATMLRGPHAFLGCKYLHLRCCAHINLVVRDELEEHLSSITKIRNVVKYVRSSGARFATFLECVEKVKINCSKKPSLDVDTRRNSTFLMLETTEKYEAAFDRLLAIDSGFKTFCGSEVDDGEVTTRKRRRNEKVMGTPDADD